MNVGNKTVKVEWCESFIKALFAKHCDDRITGIETSCFWRLAEASGLWERGTYGTPMSTALEHLTKVEAVLDEAGKYIYSVFRLL